MAKKTKKGRITIDREACKGCYLCKAFCPKGIIDISDALNSKGYYPSQSTDDGLDPEERKCTGCATCALVCPDVAIEVYRES